MTQINPNTLKSLREARHWTQAELSEKAGVDKQTIYRLEHGGQAARGRTLTRLAEALKVEPERLTRDLDPSEASAAAPPEAARSDMSVRLPDRARNALTLAAARYQVPSAQIVALAPFLFVWAAEASLRRRRDRVAALEAQFAALEALGPQFPHLSALLTSQHRGEEVLEAERASIAQRDLFGAAIPFDGGTIFSSDCDEDADNPFARFLGELGAELGEVGAFTAWGADGAPDYEVCRAEALALAGGAARGANGVISGAVKLHELPAELRRGDQGERAQWVVAEAEAAWAAFKEAHPDLLPWLDAQLAAAQEAGQ